MIRTFRWSVGCGRSCLGLALALAGAARLAQKSGGGGGGSEVVGVGADGGGGGGTKVTTTTVPVTLFGSYYGPGGSGSTVAKGSASVTFDASQTSRSVIVFRHQRQLAGWHDHACRFPG